MTRQAPATILGIETSCDETAAAIVTCDEFGSGTIRSNVVRSQLDEHAAFGGVVPELAARAHVTYLDHIIAQACREAGIALDDVDAVAATAGPGLNARPILVQGDAVTGDESDLVGLLRC